MIPPAVGDSMQNQAAQRKIGDQELQIADSEFERFRDFFYRKTGIYFEDSKRYFVDKRIIQRIQETDHHSFRSYFTYMRFQASGEELQVLINLMTVNETYFFRESYQFDCLVGPVLDEVCKNKRAGEPIRIWSMPSSTGEEPYSIALYLLERWAGINDVDIELMASDIDSRVLRCCRDAIYSPRSVKNLPADILKKYFLLLPNGDYQLCRDLRDSVEFSQVNLVDSNDTRAFRNIDVIFCRNLLIYFDDASRRMAAEVFYDALNPGGFIFLGHSESMSRITSLFNVRKFNDAITYQKPF